MAILGWIRSPNASDLFLSHLLVVLAAYIFLLEPLVNMRLLHPGWLAAAMIYALVVGPLAVARNRRIAWLLATLAVLGVAAELVNAVDGSPLTHTLRALVSMLVGALLVGVVLQLCLGAGQVTSHRVRGSVAAYLLLALVFSNAYQLVALGIPAAFSMHGAPASFVNLEHNFAYFSFVIMTTLGLGDILPLHPVSRTLVMLETALGQLFPAVLIARLVSLEITDARSRG